MPVDTPILDPDALVHALFVERRAAACAAVPLRIDPNPCLRYRWTERPCPGVYSGSHMCRHKGGHGGPCVCFYCGKRGRGKDRSDAPETEA